MQLRSVLVRFRLVWADRSGLEVFPSPRQLAAKYLTLLGGGMGDDLHRCNRPAEDDHVTPSTKNVAAHTQPPSIQSVSHGTVGVLSPGFSSKVSLDRHENQEVSSHCCASWAPGPREDEP